MIGAELNLTPLVQIFILSHDRLIFCRQAVESALSQEYKNIEVILSDNSNSSYVSEALALEYPSIAVIRRGLDVRAVEHFNIVLSEVTAPLFVLLHDDDILESDYVLRMVDFFNTHENLAAVGCNARIVRGSKMTNETLMKNCKGERIFDSPEELFLQYLNQSSFSPAPFPSYMYKKSVIEGMRFDFNNGGKHADVSFLAEILNRGNVIWTHEILYNYRIHSSNDGGVESVFCRLKLLRYLYSNFQLNPKSLHVRDYKFSYWRLFLIQDNGGSIKNFLFSLTKKRRNLIAAKFIIAYGFRMIFTRVIFWKKFFKFISLPFYRAGSHKR